MKYMLLIHSSEAEENAMPPEQLGPLMGEYMAFTEELQEAGAMLESYRLKPVATATTVRVREGDTMTTDGPFAETKEQFGGYYLIEAADLDEAIRWAAKIPTARYGSVEVRPIWEMDEE